MGESGGKSEPSKAAPQMACTEGVGFLQEFGGCCLEVATWRDAQGSLQISKDRRT